MRLNITSVCLRWLKRLGYVELPHPHLHELISDYRMISSLVKLRTIFHSYLCSLERRLLQTLCIGVGSPYDAAFLSRTSQLVYL